MDLLSLPVSLSCADQLEEKGTRSGTFYLLLPLEFWEMAKPKADGSK